MTHGLVLGGIFGEGMIPLIIVMFVGLLIFGKRLPEIGKSVGKSVVEFKKGLSGIEDEAEKAGSSNPAPTQANVQVTSPSTPAALPSGSAGNEAEIQRQLRETQEMVKALREELKASRESGKQA
jgi:sec-independent protein translocase protein TatA